ncbi:hypothetical protein AX17_001975 [Amanita inopinata Kibby_2008]|nr:hypothetical protein AX17_001975 [Amanita inopinata Kibby_2008]
MKVVPVFKIIPTTQQYEWGRIGSASKVAQLAASSRLPGFSINDTKPYAELWMGTHPTSPSRLASTNQMLSGHLAANPSLMGQNVINRFDAGNGNLPFLLKVLAVETALSIQTHPDKQTAEQLHAQQPDIYKDPNHKPEMALALTPFRALCGFRPLPEIARHLHATPELAALIPTAIMQKFFSLPAAETSPNVAYSARYTSPPPGLDPTNPEAKQALRDVFAAIMTAPEDEIKKQLSSLVQRYETELGQDTSGVSRDVIDLILRLNSQFPGDVGVFCAFVLNYVRLQPGEAIFLGAGEPHAYVEGECIECMANSNNVIRAGLTPKLRDVPNLVSGLTYTPAPPEKHIVEPAPFPASQPTHTPNKASLLYDPPIPEFSVVEVKLQSGKKEKHDALGGPSVLIVTTGGGRIIWDQSEALDLGLGDVVFVGAGTPVEFVAAEGGKEGLVVYRAFVEAHAKEEV